MIELHPDEIILLERRRYWLPFAMEALGLLVAATLPFAGFLFSESMPARLQALLSAYSLPFLFCATAWLLVIWIIFFTNWTNYYLDILLITNKRVIDVEQLGLFARDLAEMRIENIQDIRVEIVGLLASLLHFGNLHIQTAGEVKEFVIRNLYDPHAVKDIISKQHDDVMRNPPTARPSA